MEAAPVVDPTLNVIALVKADKERADDLRVAYQRLTDEKIQGLEKLMNARNELEKELREAKSDQLDANLNSIRATIASNQTTNTASLDRLTDRVNAILLDQTQHKGSNAGIREVIGYVIAGLAVLVAVIEYLLKK